MRLAAVLAMVAASGAALAGCQSFVPQAFLPQDDTPVIPARLAAAPPVTSSGQQRDKNGFPLIGAYPKAATTQVSDETVAQTRERYARTGRRGAGSTAPQYRRTVAEMQALAASQAQAAADLPAAAAPAEAGSRAQ
ncbi:hypothetical protein [Aureimonas sp. AU4]|uniref:hypothetical protein n=1 Tax=Aureimonas sp. AU4 TaxID=1638163 RepID=UPI000AC18852|nr:hypothetical protein [Aureimonas sp. AU4]